MAIFLIPILIIIGIFAVSAGGDVLKNIDISFPSFQSATKERTEKPAPQVVSPQPSATKRIPSTSTISAPFVLDTVITKGPGAGTQISGTNRVTFEFEGSVAPQDTTGRITFETKVEGVDSDWKSTSSRQRTITFPVGQNEYTFLVRAKIGKIVDTTPAQSSFNLAVSPFFGKVKISTTKAAGSSSNSLIKLTTSLDQEQEITITGWKIQGKGGSFTIPLGIGRISSSLNIIPNTNIVVKRSDTILLTGDQSPFGIGKNFNFRPNACMGYLKAYYTFPLSISSSCSNAKPQIEEITFLKESCQEFILKKINFSSCDVPDYSQNIAVSIDSTCVTYLADNFNYNSCYQKHFRESNFQKNEWHIYMNTNFIRKLHDVIELTDQNGLLVDKKVY